MVGWLCTVILLVALVVTWTELGGWPRIAAVVAVIAVYGLMVWLNGSPHDGAPRDGPAGDDDTPA